MKPIQIAMMADFRDKKELATLYSDPSVMITGPFTHPKQFETYAAHTHYDILVVDITLDEFSHLDTIQNLSDVAPHAKIITICPHPDGDLVGKLIHIGVTGILLHHEFSGNSAHFVRAVYANRFVISPKILSALLVSRSSISGVFDSPI